MSSHHTLRSASVTFCSPHEQIRGEENPRTDLGVGPWEAWRIGVEHEHVHEDEDEDVHEDEDEDEDELP
jgi:hypothetical protein